MTGAQGPKRHRLTADVSEATDARVRETARQFFGGGTGETVNAALSILDWAVRARTRGMRIVAIDDEHLPAAFEEPVIPGLGARADDWQWLVRRDHPWRRQLWLKGRNITAGSLARTAEIEGWTPEQAADQFDLPIESVLEAIRYAAQASDLINAEEAEDRLAAAGLEGRRAAVSR